jgi:hypothetical protein
MITVTIEIDTENEKDQAIKVKNYLDNLNMKIYFHIIFDPMSIEKQRKRDEVW